MLCKDRETLVQLRDALNDALDKKEPTTVEEIVDLVRHDVNISSTELVKALIEQCGVDQADILGVMDTDELKTWAENNDYISIDAPISEFMDLQEWSDVKDWIVDRVRDAL